jgi:hypothetical protein
MADNVSLKVRALCDLLKMMIHFSLHGEAFVVSILDVGRIFRLKVFWFLIFQHIPGSSFFHFKCVAYFPITNSNLPQA